MTPERPRAVLGAIPWLQVLEVRPQVLQAPLTPSTDRGNATFGRRPGLYRRTPHECGRSLISRIGAMSATDLQITALSVGVLLFIAAMLVNGIRIGFRRSRSEAVRRRRLRWLPRWLRP